MAIKYHNWNKNKPIHDKRLILSDEIQVGTMKIKGLSLWQDLTLTKRNRFSMKMLEKRLRFNCITLAIENH